jgi:serine/threonine protein kinase
VKFPEEDWGSISNAAKDLIKSMLVPENIRPSAKECMEHEWFKLDLNHASNSSIHTATIKRLKVLTKSNLFRQSIQNIIAYRCMIGEKEIERFRRLFARIDYQRIGYVSYEACKEYFMNCFHD